MSQKSPLSKGQERAAQLVAADTQTDAQIAAEIGVTRRTLTRWKGSASFASRVRAIRGAYAEQLTRAGIAERQNRIDAYNDRWQRMTRIIDERAADPALQDVPGGTTGLLVHQVKQIGAGKSAQVVDEYAVDTGLLKEMRAHEQQAAQELGQWVDKRHEDVSGEVTVKHEFDFARYAELFDAAVTEEGERSGPRLIASDGT